MTPDLSLYLVTDRPLAAAAGHDLTDLVDAAVRSGVTTVQVRDKDAPAGVVLDTVRRLAERLPPEVTLLVNDRVDVFLGARAVGVRVSGVHVGQHDLPAALVRQLVGPDAVVGVSASTEEQLRAAAAAGADYVGIGPLHATPTKPDAPPPLGVPALARLVAASAVPAVAIGGVSARDVPGLRAVGAAGVAVVSAICSAPDPGAAARELRTAWEGRS